MPLMRNQPVVLEKAPLQHALAKALAKAMPRGLKQLLHCNRTAAARQICMRERVNENTPHLPNRRTRKPSGNQG